MSWALNRGRGLVIGTANLAVMNLTLMIRPFSFQSVCNNPSCDKERDNDDKTAKPKHLHGSQHTIGYTCQQVPPIHLLETNRLGS